MSGLFAAAAVTLLFASHVAVADDVYMCEIVSGDSTQLIIAANTNLVLAPGFQLITHSDEATHTLDVKIYKNTHADSLAHPARLQFDAQIEEGPDARPILVPLGPVTLECKNQNPDALTWSLRALKFAQKSHDGLGEKVEDEVVGLKSGVSSISVPDSTQLFPPPVTQKIRAD